MAVLYTTCGVARECIASAGRVARAGGVAKQRLETPVAVLKLLVVLLNSALTPVAVLLTPVVLIVRAH